MIGTRSKLVLAALAAAMTVGTGASAQLDDMDGMGAGRARMQPVPPPPGTRVDRDIAYGSDAAQRLDVYRPAKAERAPIIVMVHGGGWWRGDKGHPPVTGNKLNRWLPKGYIFVSVNYRMVPAADPVVQASDVAKALAYVQQNAAKWGGDPDRVVMMGHSAGAHLIVLLASAPDMVAAAGAKPWRGTVALDSGAYNVVDIMQGRHFNLYDRAFGTDPALWKNASPTLRIKAAPAPLLLVCSSRRAESCAQANGFADRAKALSGRATVVPVDMSHGEINALLGLNGAYTDTVDVFLGSLGGG